MNKFDLTFKCEFGKYKLNEAKRLPNKEELERTMNDLVELGLGKTLEIIIKPLE